MTEVTDTVISDAWNLDTTLAGWLSVRLSALADELHGWPGNEEYPQPEDWEYDLRLAAELLHEYWDLEMNSRIMEFNGPDWINDYQDHEAEIFANARVALHWVADQLTHLWD